MSEDIKRSINFDDDQNCTVDADKWPDMSPSELQDQLDILNRRLLTASQMHNIIIITQINKGIAQVQSHITAKMGEDRFI